MAYTERDLLRLARRWRNAKRGYLLVNPLQAKHLPVSPGAALAMMAALGEAVARRWPSPGPVIGFAETATAVGAMAALGRGGDSPYIHTTREPLAASDDALDFLEEHSHAAEQWLRAEKLGAWIEAGGVPVLVDDEISTGRTLENIARTLRRRFPALAHRRLGAASLINRLSDARLEALARSGIDCCWLLRLPLVDYEDAVLRFDIHPAEPPARPAGPVICLDWPHSLPDLRLGAPIGDWMARCEAAADALIARLAPGLSGRKVLALGTEECMLPALVFGRRLEAAGLDCAVRCHATTRSPIGLCPDGDYPIKSGHRLRSLYDPERTTYIYNLAPCDIALILTDAPAAARDPGLADLAAALHEHGAREIAAVRIMGS